MLFLLDLGTQFAKKNKFAAVWFSLTEKGVHVSCSHVLNAPREAKSGAEAQTATCEGAEQLRLQSLKGSKEQED